ncbi:MAG: NAD(P)/FAD-dependent oxidoreductase [Sulfurospirillum sp.]|nr:NAD(P)/FAD-dependent oxidoreductase [Sulfurospirillum sp.]
MKKDLIIIGGGAAGMMCAISAARRGKKVLVLEKLPQLGLKLKASGGGRCNISNTLENEIFMEHFGKNGRFMQDALRVFDHKSLIEFFASLQLTCNTKDGLRIFPDSHDSQSVLNALKNELQRLHVAVICGAYIQKILTNDGAVMGVQARDGTYMATNVVIATGGLGYPMLGGGDDGHKLAQALGHKITQLYPAMMPLFVKEEWVGHCRADTIAKATLRVALLKYKNLHATGDLIFTQNGIRGPLVLDFAREITPLLEKYGEIPIHANLIKGLNEEQVRVHCRAFAYENPQKNILETLKFFLPQSVIIQFCKLCGVDENASMAKIDPQKRDALLRQITKTPLHVSAHEGFKKAMITRGGVSLKQINPKSMQSKLVKGLYFCGEVLDLDGPCGGYNLQWAFSSGYLCGLMK